MGKAHYERFVEESTIHGLVEILKYPKIRKIIWLIIYAITIIFGISQISGFIWSYANHETVTKTEIELPKRLPYIAAQIGRNTAEKDFMPLFDPDKLAKYKLSNGDIDQYLSMRSAWFCDIQKVPKPKEYPIVSSNASNNINAVGSLLEVMTSISPEPEKAIRFYFGTKPLLPEKIPSKLGVKSLGPVYEAITSGVKLASQPYVVLQPVNCTTSIAIFLGSKGRRSDPAATADVVYNCGVKKEITVRVGVRRRHKRNCESAEQATHASCPFECLVKEFSKIGGKSSFHQFCLPYMGMADSGMNLDSYCTWSKTSPAAKSCDMIAFRACKARCDGHTYYKEPCEDVYLALTESINQKYDESAQMSGITLVFQDYDKSLIYMDVETFDWQTLISNIGAILGLCCGISILTVSHVFCFCIEVLCLERKNQVRQETTMI